MNEYEFNPNMYKLVAKNVNKYRKLKNITISNLAKDTDISEKFLNKFLNEDNNIVISIYDLYKISVVLEVSIDKFFE